MKKCDNCCNRFVCQEYIYWIGLNGNEPNANSCNFYKEIEYEGRKMI